MHDCVHKMTDNKAAGYDALSGEHIKYVGVQHFVHLCLLFNALIAHSFVSDDFCFGTIIIKKAFRVCLNSLVWRVPKFSTHVL